jgi:hypothetical protein
LTDADLTAADLTSANLNDADLNRANFDQAVLKDIQFHNVKNIGKIRNIKSAKGLEKATAQLIDEHQKKIAADLTDTSKRSLQVDQREIKIWDLMVEKYGLVQLKFKDDAELTNYYDGLSDIELNLLKHRMFTEADSSVLGQPGGYLGVLFTVNFMPGNVEIPVEIRWISPDNKVHAQKAKVKYMQHYVVSHELPQSLAEIYGTWNVEFYFDGNRIGSRTIEVLNKEEYQVRLKNVRQQG